MSKWDEMTKEAVHNEQNVKGFFGDYRFLSNFYPCEVYFEGLLYSSTEAAYQAAKTLDLEARKLFLNVTAGGAKKMGKVLELRKDWNKVKFDIMCSIVFEKFYRHLDLRKQLLETGDKHLEELNWWNDQIWGTCNGVGQNRLGITLMKIRQFWQEKE